MSLTTSVSTLRLLIEITFMLVAIKSHFKRSYDKQNLTLVVNSYENSPRLVLYIYYEMTTRVRSFNYVIVANVLPALTQNAKSRDSMANTTNMELNDLKIIICVRKSEVTVERLKN